MRSTLRALYSLVAVLAIMHMLGLLGAVGFLCATGRLTADRANAIMDILLGEEDSDEDQSAQEQAPKAVARTSEESIAREQLQEEKLRLAIERKLAELHQKQVAVNVLMQKVTEDTERLEVDKQAFYSEKGAEKKKEQDEGFQKTLELLETSAPDVAKNFLLEINTEDEAARLLQTMDTRKGTKILQAAMEDPLLRAKALKVLRRVKELAPENSDWAQTQPPGGSS